MSVSRRIFLRSASVVGLTAVIPGGLTGIVFGQSTAPGDGFEVPLKALKDPLYSITQEMFAQTLNNEYRFRVDGETHSLRLIKVLAPESATTSPSSKEEKTTEEFTLVFEGDSETPIPQGTYTVKHATFGKLRMFIVPGPAEGRNPQKYEALFNRLPR